MPPQKKPVYEKGQRGISTFGSNCIAAFFLGFFGKIKRFFSNSTEPLEVASDGTLYVFNEPVRSHKVLKELGRGANGVVYLALNRALNREEAIKVWLKLRDGDHRDKIEQGLQEATKLARVNGKNAVQIFSVQVLKNAVVASMEYVFGITLNEYRKGNRSNRELVAAALNYLYIIEATSSPDTFHGDPHLNNVLVYENHDDPHDPKLEMKLCDFGTSVFSGPGFSENRHWGVVRDSVRKLTKKLPDSDQVWESTRDLGEESRILHEKMKERPDLFSAKNTAGARIAALRDYIDYWRLELYQPITDTKAEPPSNKARSEEQT